jgi:hypothetical protein
MSSGYTGRIHQGPSTVAAVFYNSAQAHPVYMDERDLSDYIDVTKGLGRQPYIDAIRDLQAKKAELGIPLDYKPFEEWEISS